MGYLGKRQVEKESRQQLYIKYLMEFVMWLLRFCCKVQEIMIEIDILRLSGRSVYFYVIFGFVVILIYLVIVGWEYLFLYGGEMWL